MYILRLYSVQLYGIMLYSYCFVILSHCNVFDLPLQCQRVLLKVADVDIISNEPADCHNIQLEISV